MVDSPWRRSILRKTAWVVEVKAELHSLVFGCVFHLRSPHPLKARLVAIKNLETML
jgi:hypothetical protein